VLGILCGWALAISEISILITHQGSFVFHKQQMGTFLLHRFIQDLGNLDYLWIPLGLDRMFAPHFSEYALIFIMLLAEYGIVGAAIGVLGGTGGLVLGNIVKWNSGERLDQKPWAQAGVISVWILLIHKVLLYDYFYLITMIPKLVIFLGELILLTMLLAALLNLKQKRYATDNAFTNHNKRIWLSVAGAIGIIGIISIGLKLITGWVPMPASISSSIEAPPRIATQVILISVDTLRADHLGVYGYRHDTTPHLDNFAQQATVFETAISSSSWTLPAMMSVMTSTEPVIHRVEDDGHFLTANLTTVAEQFQSAGFRTGAFVSHYYVSSNFGFNKGFSNFEEFGQQTHKPMSNPTAEQLNEKVLPWLTAQQTKPFFLYIHYFDPHWDYIPPDRFHEPFDTGYTGPISGHDFWTTFNLFKSPSLRLPPGARDHIVSLYDGEIRYWDYQFGILLEHLTTIGIREQVSIMFMADHGEEFEDHKSLGHFHTLYDELIRVPLIIQLPRDARQVTDIKRYSQMVSSIDVAPTALALAGLPSPIQFRGNSLLPLIRGQQESPREIISASIHLETDKISLRTDRWKFIQNYNPTIRGIELYDLREGIVDKSVTHAMV